MAHDGMPGGDDPELARLGQVFRDELRADAAADEALAAKDLLRGRSLTDVAVELLHRGDRMRADVAATTFTGVIADVAGDRLRVATATGDVDLDLGAVTALHVVERVRSGGRSRSGRATGFTARLHELEAAGAEVELGGPALPAVRGRIAAVAVDHVVLDGPAGRAHHARRVIGWVRVLA